MNDYSAVGWDEALANPSSEETLPILFHLPTQECCPAAVLHKMKGYGWAARGAHGC